MFVIMFKTGHALPLRERRTWCPRMSRDGHAAFPRNIGRSWTWHRPVHGLDSAGNRTRTGAFRVREQSVSAFSPRKQARPRSGRVLGNAADSTVRELAATTDSIYPQTVRSRELSTSPDCPRAQSVRERGLAKNCPHHRIAVSILPPINFQVRIQTIPTYDLV